MQTFSELTSAGRAALTQPGVLPRFTDLIEVCNDLPVPVFPDKSAKQVGVDLVHPMLNALFTRWLVDVADWEPETAVSALTDLKDERRFDFTFELPDGRYFALEVQLGNGGRLQTDFDKFRMLQNAGKLAFGAVVYLTRETAKGADSGLAIYETACKSALTNLDDMPLAIVGLEREGSQEVDLSKIPGIVFPSLLGGEGENRDKLQHYVATCLLDGASALDIALETVHQQIVEAHALKHLRKTLAAFKADVTRILALPDDMPIKAVLLAELMPVVQSTWVPQDVRDTVVQAAEIHKAAAERQKQDEREQKRLEKANTPRANPEAEHKRAKQVHSRLQRELRQLTKEVDASARYVEETAQLAAQAGAVSTIATDEPLACAANEPLVSAPQDQVPAPRAGVRVIRADEARRQREEEEARRQIRIPERPKVLPNTAMGQAFGAAGLQALAAAKTLRRA